VLNFKEGTKQHDSCTQADDEVLDVLTGLAFKNSAMDFIVEKRCGIVFWRDREWL
jgi:hypothetical protein